MDANIDNKTLRNQICEGLPKAIYWHKKRLGSREAEINYHLLKEAKKSGSAVGEITEYTDRYGNHWRVCQAAFCYKDVDMSFTRRLAFIYEETIGSCSMIVPTFATGNKAVGCVIYTSHFFLRFCQRLGIEYMSSDMLQKFLSVVPQFVMSLRDDYDHKGRRRVDAAFPGSIGRGHVRGDISDNVIVMCSYLTAPQLSPKQTKSVSTLRSYDKEIGGAPTEVRMARFMKDKESLTGYLDKLKDYGCEERVDIITSVMAAVVESFISLGWVSMEDSHTFYRLGCNTQNTTLAAVDRMALELDWVSAFYEVLLVAREGAKSIGLKDYNTKKVAQHLIDRFWKDYEYDTANIDRDLNEYQKKVENYLINKHGK